MRTLAEIIDAAFTKGAHDLDIAVGKPPRMRTSSGLVTLGASPVTSEEFAEALKSVAESSSSAPGEGLAGLIMGRTGWFRVTSTATAVVAVPFAAVGVR